MKYMKIGILTLRLRTNYGGILQNYALQTVLRRLGYEPVTICYSIRDSYISKILSIGKRLFLKVFRKKNILIRAWLFKREHETITQNTRFFVNKYILTTKSVPINEVGKLCANLDVVVVGSDQVWRPKYAKRIEEFFLKSLKRYNIRKIAYAASFGTENWEYTLKQTKRCARLAKRFDFISVRERSGIELCQEYLNVNAIHLLDPTMLLDKEDYICLVEQEKTKHFSDSLFVYILDRSKEKEKIVRAVSEELDVNPFSVMPEKHFADVGAEYIEQCIFPPVTDWLRGFVDASFVVTDSFHGMVFSIIFNKPFIVIANEERGLGRFVSLLEMFDLKDRLVFSLQTLTSELIRMPIDFVRVNLVKKMEQEKAACFLQNALRDKI